MGMSDDFIEAVSVNSHLISVLLFYSLQIHHGSTNIRVGTALFGPREE